MHFIFKLFLISPLLYITLSHAQVLNIEKVRLDQDSLKPLKVKLVADLQFYNRTAGENDPNKSTEIEFNLNSIYEPGKHGYILIAEVSYDRTNGLGLLNFGFIHGRINWFQERNFSYESFAQVSYDHSRGMDNRYLVGGNIRYNIINEEKHEVYVGSGLMLESEKWQHPYNDSSVNSDLIKTNNYISYKVKLNDYLDINNVFYYQAGIYENQFINRINNWLILNTQISKHLSLVSSITMNFDDKPIVPITKFIYTLKTGIAVNL